MRPSNLVVLPLILSSTVSCAPEAPADSKGYNDFEQRWQLVASIEEDGWSRGSPSSIASADLLSDGSIVVADGDDNSLRLFDSTGQFIRTLGRKGRGPGEFAGLRWVGVMRGDTIVTYSMSYQELSLWTTEGPASKRTRVRGVPWGLVPSGMLADGSIFFASIMGIRATHNAPQKVRTIDSGSAVLLVRPGYSPIATAPLPLAVVVRDRDFSVRLPLSPRMFGAACDTLAFTTWSAESSILAFDKTATLVDSFTHSLQAARIPDGVWNAALDQTASGPDPDGWHDRARELRGLVPPATRYPRIAALIAESCSRIWVRSYESSSRVAGADTNLAARWLALDQRGKILDSVYLPSTASILRMTPNRMLVRVRNEDDVPALGLFSRR